MPGSHEIEPRAGYRAGQRLSPRGRLLAALAVGGLHLGGFAALLLATPATPPPEPVLMQVAMLAEAPLVTVPPPPPPPPEKPQPQPRLMSTPKPKPTPSAIATPPPDPEPVGEAVAEAPAPPAPPAPAAEPATEPAVVPPNFVAAYLNNPPPVYPYAAKLRRESGEVRLRVLVTREGTAGDVRIEQSSGSSSLDQAARDVVFRKWRFVPAKRGDETIEAWVIVPVVFEMKS